MKKSILFLPRWYPNKTDVQLGTFIRQQAILLKDDFDISVIYVHADSSAKQKFEFIENKKEGIHEIIVYFKEGTGPFKKLINLNRYKKAQQLAYKKLNRKVDLCHVHVPYRSAPLALYLKRKQQVEFVVTEHWSGHLTGDFQKKNKLDQTLYKTVLKKAAAISCVSELLQKKFKTNTGFDSDVIPNYIEHFPIDVESEPTNKLQLLSVSDMIDTVKNISGLIKAFSDAIKTNANLHLTLIGGGPDEEKILDLITELQLQQQISFRGRQPHISVLTEMNSCHFYICNSNFETFGMTVAEALRAGKPVISTKCGGPEEFLNSNNSILINPKNNEELKSAILKMATEFQNYNSENLATEIENRFGKNTIKQKLISFYQALFK